MSMTPGEELLSCIGSSVRLEGGAPDGLLHRDFFFSLTAALTTDWPSRESQREEMRGKGLDSGGTPLKTPEEQQPSVQGDEGTDRLQRLDPTEFRT